MAFAGAAGAADITGGAISGVPLVDNNTLSPYTIANETILVAANLKTVQATTGLVIEMDSPVTIAENAVIPFAVEFKLTGDATFTSAPAFDVLEAEGIAPSTGVVVVSDAGKTLTFYVEYKGPVGGETIESLDLTKLGLTINSRSDVFIEAVARVTVAGFTQKVTELTKTKIITFKNALKPFELELATTTAALTDYTEFGTLAGPQSATASSNDLKLEVYDDVYADATGGNPLELDDILDGIKVVVTGHQVKTLDAKIGGVAPVAASLTETSGTFNLAVTDFGTNKKLVLNNADDAVIEAGTYQVAVTPEFDELFEGSASSTKDALKISLEGTNFYVPWFAMNSPAAVSTLRLANNGTVDVGPIIISLKANNGTSAPTGTHTIDSIPAGGFVSVNGTTLKTAFGNDAKNGDLLVTIQANVANVSAKVRTTQQSGQVFENSVGATIDIID